MLQLIKETHLNDSNGNPAGGQTTGTGISINWQNGPLQFGDKRKEPDGAFVEGVMQAALGRLKYYQSTKFSCRENSLAITKLEEALHWCQHRTRDREDRQVEGTHSV